jgi:hypothetical protein
MVNQGWGGGMLSLYPYFDIRQSCQLYSPAALYPQENALVLIGVRG